MYPVIEPGMFLRVEQTIGLATANPQKRIVEGIVYRDEEGTLRIPADSFAPNLERDERGYFQNGIVIISIAEVTR